MSVIGLHVTTKFQDNMIFDKFVTEFKLLSKDCSNADEMIQGQIVFGVASPKKRAKLINVGKDLTLDKTIEDGQHFEYYQEQLKSTEGTTRSRYTPSTLMMNIRLFLLKM